jgi:hypothetical protein
VARAPGGWSERATGLEPATSSLGSWHSTTELRPRDPECKAEEAEAKEAEPTALSASLGRRRLEKTAKVRLANGGLSGRDVVEPSCTHPAFQLTDQIEQVLE